MSELTAYNSERIYWAVEQVEQEAGDIEDLHLDDNLFYLKSKADAFIADLEESNKKEVEQLLIEIVKQKEGAKNLILDNYLKAEEIRHHKYKRCLEMVREWRNYAIICWMQSYCHNHRGFGKTAEKYSRKEGHAWKCVKRCKELAEKFKEAKFHK